MTNNDEKFEKMIFDFCKNDTEVPPYIDKAVKDGLDRCKNSHSKVSKPFSLKRIAVILICFGLLATGGVFAINYIVSLFTNSTPGIDSATQNGFVHNIDMDFVYDNNIGIKVDNVVMNGCILNLAEKNPAIVEKIVQTRIETTKAIIILAAAGVVDKSTVPPNKTGSK